MKRSEVKLEWWTQRVLVEAKVNMCKVRLCLVKSKYKRGCMEQVAQRLHYAVLNLTADLELDLDLDVHIQSTKGLPINAHKIFSNSRLCSSLMEVVKVIPSWDKTKITIVKPPPSDS